MPESCRSYNTFKVVESGGGGFCSVHSLEYILSGKLRAGKDYIARYREWAKVNGNPFPTDINFKRWSTNDWSNPVSMFDMLIATSSNVPFIIHDPKARSGRMYTLDELFKLLDKREHHKLRASTNPRFIVGTGMHWMPMKSIENRVAEKRDAELLITPRKVTVRPKSAKKITFKIIRAASKSFVTPLVVRPGMVLA